MEVGSGTQIDCHGLEIRYKNSLDVLRGTYCTGNDSYDDREQPARDHKLSQLGATEGGRTVVGLDACFLEKAT